MVLRETLQRIHIVLKETLCRFDLTLRVLLHQIPHALTFSATCTKLVGFTTFPSSTIAWIYVNATLFFDADSSFWVCDNSATGHICNDELHFLGEHVPSIYLVGAATETSEPTFIGTVVLCLTTNNGDKHTFTLTHVKYMPKSPVNLLLTRVLS
jgi:hypothetical protein